MFFINRVMVIGPTPPGTGVMNEHLGATLSKSTSPRRRNPDLRVASGTRVVPTSTTTAPSDIMSAVRNPGFPRAQTMMSARRVRSPMFRVAEWQTVTVALPG